MAGGQAVRSYDTRWLAYLRRQLQGDTGRAATEKPRHAGREAGLIISSDLCPVTPGSYTRLSTSLHVIMFERLGQSVISLLELDYPSRALAP